MRGIVEARDDTSVMFPVVIAGWKLSLSSSKSSLRDLCHGALATEQVTEAAMGLKRWEWGMEV